MTSSIRKVVAPSKCGSVVAFGSLLLLVSGCFSEPASNPAALDAASRITRLSPESAAVLVKTVKDAHDGAYVLQLDGLTTLSRASAAVLATLPENSNLCLTSISALPLDVAEALATARCSYLSLNRLAELPDDLAAVLAGYRASPNYGGSLHLNGVKKVSREGLASLARSKVTGLSLNGLESLSVEEAQALAEFQGRVLWLRGLRAASPEVAKALAGFRGEWLELSGLEQLSHESAKSLAAFPGDTLCLEGLRNPSDDVLQELRAVPRLMLLLPEPASEPTVE